VHKQVKEVYEIMRNVFYEHGHTLGRKTVLAALIKQYGFDVSRKVSPRFEFLIADKILVPIQSARVSLFSLNVSKLADLLGDSKLEKDLKKEKKKFKRDAKMHLSALEKAKSKRRDKNGSK